MNALTASNEAASIRPNATAAKPGASHECLNGYGAPPYYSDPNYANSTATNNDSMN